MTTVSIGDGWFRVEKKPRKPKKSMIAPVEEHEAPSKEPVLGKHSRIGTMPKNIIKSKPITAEFRAALQQGRVNKKITRKQLAMLVNERESVIEAYESGTCSANHIIIDKLNKALGISLPHLQTKTTTI